MEKFTVLCPCCNELLTINIQNNNISIKEQEEIEISEVIKKLGIEFG